MEHVRKELWTGTNQVQGFFAFFFFLNLHNKNSITHLQQDSASVQSKILINTFICSSAQNTVCTFQAKNTLLYLMLQCTYFLQVFSVLPKNPFLLFALSSTAILFLQASLFHCPVFYNIFLLSTSSSYLFFSVFPPVSHSLSSSDSVFIN